MARNKEIEIDTRLGRRCIDTDKVIHFPRGLAGFENERDFILLQIRPEAPLLILQSVSTPVVGLLVADPYSFFDKSYAPQVGDAEKQLLSIESLEQAAVLVTVSIPAGAPEKAVLNLTGPIVINYEVRMGLQVPQSADGPQQVNMHSLKPVEAEEQAAAQSAGEVAPSCGCSHKDAPQE
ncbi:flagellar assembly protein FliW [Desulfovibrio desulfuricans]|uniref:Flagellar assembly factor FliW n=1 Tax=Desulfovibrio desulfuricans TaxID=876 RepID=A0A4P7UL32_DESDE|nr:flagellar assembly protein FliW [Desulfovibrio desulfuricans]QCC86487.1 flagellar assembly protein FliW [Desulfovibrio desulfuricans]